MELTLYSLVGMCGAFGYLLSYALLQLKRDYAKTMSYSLLNLFSALLVAISLLKDFNAGSMFIQLSWILISVYGVVRCLKYVVTKRQNLPENRIKELEREILTLRQELEMEFRRLGDVNHESIDLMANLNAKKV